MFRNRSQANLLDVSSIIFFTKTINIFINIDNTTILLSNIGIVYYQFDSMSANG